MLEHEFTIRFITGSPHTTPMELMQGIKDSIQYVLHIHSSIFPYSLTYQTSDQRPHYNIQYKA
jgi:hypothetical protein